MEQFFEFITHHWLLWLAFLIILTLILINEKLTQSKMGKSLSPQQAVDQINHHQAVIIDIRDKEAFKSGHTIDAVNASPSAFEQGKMNKYKSTPIILLSTRNIEAQSLAVKIRALGFEQVFVLHGGIAAWKEASLPVVKGNKG